MNAAHCLWVVLALVARDVLCDTDDCPEVCVLDDFECVTPGAFNVYKAVVTGTDGVNCKMDPLKFDRVETEDAIVKTIRDVELKGLSKCKLNKLQLRVNNDTYEHYLHCPELVMSYNYGTNFNRDQLASIVQVRISLTSRNIDILNSGAYGVYVNSEDFQPHFFIKSINSKVDSTAEMKCGVLSIDDQKGWDNGLHCKTNLLIFRKIFTVVIKKAMKSVFAGIDKHIRALLMGKVLPRNATVYDI